MKLGRSSVGTLLGMLCVTAFAVAPRPAAAQSAPKIGVFDAQRISQETAEGRKIHARLSALQEKKRQELGKLQEELDKLQQEFVQTASSLSDDKRKDLSIKIERKQIELDGAQKSASREVQVEVDQVQDEWQRRILDVVAGYGKQQSYTLLMPVEVVPYFSPTIDVTAELIALIDKPAAPAAAPAPPVKK